MCMDTIGTDSNGTVPYPYKLVIEMDGEGCGLVGVVAKVIPVDKGFWRNLLGILVLLFVWSEDLLGSMADFAEDTLPKTKEKRE